MPIGNEILPNVYISNIEIHDKKIDFLVMSLDSIEKPVWSSKDVLRNSIELKILYVINDVSLANNITNGIVRIKKTDKNVDRFLLKELRAKNITTEGSYFENHRVYLKKCSIPFDEEVKDLTVFANLFIDGIEQEGPITSEKIIINNFPPDKATAFLKNGEQYYGAVHVHNNRFMEFAYHRTAKHSFLQDISVPNHKIKDLRGKKYNTKQYNIKNEIPIFSDLFTSFDKETKHNHMFFLNLREILIQNTKYGGMLEAFGPSVFLPVLNNFAYRVFNIDRYKIKAYNRLTIGTRNTKDLDKIIEIKNIITSTQNGRNMVSNRGPELNPVSHNFGNGIHGFYFKDDLDDHSPGDYQYRLEFIFTDPTIKLIRTYISDLKNTVERAEFYKNLLSRTGRYDYFLKIPNPVFESNTKELPDSYIDLANSLNKYKAIIYEMTKQDIEQDLMRSYSLLNPNSCTIESVSVFVEEALLLLDKYINIFEMNTNLIKSNYENPSLPKSSLKANIITIEHRFKDVITPMKSAKHYVYDTNTLEPASPETFGNRGVSFPFKAGIADPKLDRSLNEAILEKNSKSPFYVVPFAKEDPKKKERYLESTEYLGNTTNFNSFQTNEKEEFLLKETVGISKIQLKMTTNVSNLQQQIAEEAINKIEVLNGFEKTTDGRNQMKKPIWSDHSGDSISNTAIVKQAPLTDRPEDIDFPFANEYMLLNNTSRFNIGEKRAKRRATQPTDNVYKALLVTSNVVTNPAPEDVIEEPVTTSRTTSVSGESAVTMQTTSIGGPTMTSGGGY